jgi:MFS family permease
MHGSSVALLLLEHVYMAMTASISMVSHPWSVARHHNFQTYPYSDQDIFVKHFGTETTDGQYKISPSELSVMTSMINVGELVGSLSAAPLNDLFGRKIVFLIAAAMLVIGVVLQLVTSSSRGLITGGRTIMGLGVGAFSSTSPLYIAVSTVV